jgi:methanogenic corrinoid protein MtbC1
LRDSLGERAYSLPQIEKLRVVKRLMDTGHRPGKLVALSVEALRQLGEQGGDAPRAIDGAEATAALQSLLALLRGNDVRRLRGQLRQSVVRLGLGAFVTEVLAPLNTLVGEAWMNGQLEIFQEHLYSETAQSALRAGIQSLPEAHTRQRPRVLLSTLTGESHGLGLLMAEALLAAEGAQCVSLGTQTPVWDLALAAQAYRADLVALSFTACMNPNKVVEGLTELRAKLPSAVEVWVGGSAPVLRRRPVAGVAAMRSLSELPEALRHWRAVHP